MNDAFWCITLGMIVLRLWWKSGFRNRRKNIEEDLKSEPVPIPEQVIEINGDLKEQQAQKKADKQREKDIADLKRQGYTDELIAVILPTINNGQ